MPSWLDDLITQVGEFGSDAVPSEAATDTAFNPARDSQAANSLFGALFEGGNPDAEQAAPAVYGAGAPDMTADNRDIGGGWNPSSGPTRDSGGILSALAQKVGLKRSASGDIDYSDPKTIDALLKLTLSGGNIVNSLINRGRPQNYKSAAQLQAEIKSPLSSWTPQQQAGANAFFGKPMQGPNHQMAFAANMPSPLVAGRGYAHGGSIAPNADLSGLVSNVAASPHAKAFMSSGASNPYAGWLQVAQGQSQPAIQANSAASWSPITMQRSAPATQVAQTASVVPQSFHHPQMPQGPLGVMHMARGGRVPGYAHGGALGHVMAETGGQDDVVPINAAGGEYMMDADSVSALGDGNNAAGAKKLDEMRMNLRKHKRSAPPDKIPPKAKPVEHYMKGGR